jgi:hypothetical protein
LANGGGAEPSEGVVVDADELAEVDPDDDVDDDAEEMAVGSACGVGGGGLGGRPVAATCANADEQLRSTVNNAR